jgi:hypothetical protein
VDIQSRGGADFLELAARLRRHESGKQIRSAINRVLNGELDQVVRAQRRNMLGIESRGIRGRGSARRETFTRHRSPRTRSRAFGLRATVARSVQRRVKWSGRQYGAVIRVDRQKLPQSQRRLPAHMNKGQWRHPVFGDTERWVRQEVTPGWFSKPLGPATPRIRRLMAHTVDITLRRLT